MLQFDNSLEVQLPFQALSMQLYTTPIVLQGVQRIIFVITIKVAYCRITVVEATSITAPRPWVYIREKTKEVQ